MGQVGQNLQRVVAYVQEDEAGFVRCVMENKTAVQKAEREQARRKLEKQERRISELDRIIQQLYEDRVAGALSAERFAKLSDLSGRLIFLQNIAEIASRQPHDTTASCGCPPNSQKVLYAYCTWTEQTVF